MELVITEKEEGHAVEEQENQENTDGHTVEGHAVEGHAVESHAVEGHAVEGHAVEEQENQENQEKKKKKVSFEEFCEPCAKEPVSRKSAAAPAPVPRATSRGMAIRPVVEVSISKPRKTVMPFVQTPPQQYKMLGRMTDGRSYRLGGGTVMPMRMRIGT